jgi:hypothetical protein
MMSKGPLERRERLLRACKSIIDNPCNVDGDVVAAFKTAALRYANTQYGAPEQVLKRLYCDEGELGDLMRGAVDVVVSKSQLEVSPATGAMFSRTRQLLDDENDDDDELDEVITKSLRDHHRGHHSLSAALVQHLHDRLERRRERHGYTKRKESTMDKTETLRAIAKAGGIIAVAKAIVDENRNYGITEHEFVELATEHAKAQHPNLTDAAAFAKIYQIPEVWRACNVLKAMPFVANVTPVMVGGEDTRDLSDTSKAIEQLKELGARKWPMESAAAQFERALTAPENHVLARRAVPIPRATTSFPYPR